MAIGLKSGMRRRRIGMKQAPLAQAKLITAQAPKITIPQSQTATPAARAAQTDFAGQADGVNTARIMQDKGGNIVGGEFGFGNGVQKYDQKKIAWVMQRGASGGSLSTADKAIYDRMMYLRAQKTAQEHQTAQEQTALDAAHAEDERKRKLDAEEWDRQEKIRRAARNEDEIAREKRKAEADAAALAEERKYKEQQDSAKRAKVEADNGRTSDMTDEDYAKWMQLGGNKGRAEFAYTKQDQDWIDKRRREVQDMLTAGRINGFEAAEMNRQIDERSSLFRKEVRQKDGMPTSDAPIISEDKKWYWDTTKQSVDGRTGAWVPMPNEQKPTEPTWNGMTFKDFVLNAPKTRQVEKDVSVNGKIVKQMVDVEIPYDERIAIAESEWKKRIGGGAVNNGTGGVGSPIVVSPFDPLHPNNPATASAPSVPATSEDWRTKLGWNHK